MAKAAISGAGALASCELCRAAVALNTLPTARPEALPRSIGLSDEVCARGWPGVVIALKTTKNLARSGEGYPANIPSTNLL